MALSIVTNYYIEVDVLCVILLVSLAIKTRTSNFISSQKNHFQAVLVSNIVLTASDMIWIYNNNFQSLLGDYPSFGITMSYIVNGINVVSSAMLGLTWLLFAEAVQGNYILHERKWRTLVLVFAPIIVLLMLTLTTKHTHLMFYVAKDGRFTRGAGYALQVAIAYAYMLLSVILAFRRARYAKTQQERNQSLSIASFAVAPFISGVAQMLLPQMSVLFIGTVVALLYVYISLQEQQVLTDPLTGLNNRILLDQKINAAISTWNGSSDLYLLVIDADNFKGINDKYGHIEGDRALITIADALRQNGEKEDFLCRSGGDEFVVLHHAAHGDDCSQFINGITEMLSMQKLPYKLTVSIGKQRYTPDMKMWKDFMDAADAEMYRVKGRRS